MSDVRDRLRALDAISAPEQWPEIAGRHPGSAARLDRSAVGRLATTLVAISLAAAGTLLAVDRLSPRESQSEPFLDVSTWATHEVPALDLAFRYPPDWSVQPFEERLGHAGFVGAVVSNVDQRVRHPDLAPGAATSVWDLRGLPDDAIVISIQRVSTLFSGTSEPNTALPLRIDDADPQTAGAKYVPDGWEKRWLPFIIEGGHNTLQIAIGPDLSSRDREVARLIVASIEPLEPLEPASFDGWRVEVSVEHSASGPLEIEVRPVHDGPDNDAMPWIQHTLVLRNTGNQPLSFDDTRVGKLLGRPDPELLAGDQGCGFADPGGGQPLHWGVCLGYLDAFTIPSGGVERREITLWKDLRGLAPLEPGEYVFEKVYRFRIGDSDAVSEVRLNLVYTIERAE